MPQYFLQTAGLDLEDFKGEVGFSGSHDATIKLVEAGTYDIGAVNEQVWKSRKESGDINLEQVNVIWRTPAYYDYHWVIHPDAEKVYGAGFIEKVQNALLNLDATLPEHKEILELFGANQFIATQNQNYQQIESIGREIGKIK